MDHLQNAEGGLHEIRGMASNGVSWTLYQEDSRNAGSFLQPNSINCVISSPPYYCQRDYGVENQIGLEPSIVCYVNDIVRVFREIKPSLVDDGVVFLNLGDTYYSAKGRPHGNDPKHKARRLGLRAVDSSGLGLPRKSLIGIPWRVALAMSADGWTLRSAITWVKQTSMPEPSAKDRPWRKSEMIFLFSKKPKYFFDRNGLAGEEDVWFIEPDRNSSARGVHYAPYPKSLVERCIKCGCPENGTVLDPFVGGGTTMEVAINMRRPSIGIEVNPDFCKLIAASLNNM